jgi:hypothetical protein
MTVYRIKYAEPGQGLVEYSLILVLVVVAALLALNAFGLTVTEVYCEIARALGATETCSSYFSDDFDGDLNDWVKVRGTWELKDGQLCGGPSEGRIFADVPQSDYIVNIKGADLSQGNGYGVYFRSNDYNNVDGYNFQYDPGWGGGAFLTRKWVNGNELSPLSSNRVPGYDWYNTPHDVQIKVEGSTYTTYVDGQQVAQATDNSYSGDGGIGLRTWDNTKVCFDSVSIDPLP